MGLMMQRLLGNVALHLLNLREPDGEHPIAALPAKVPKRLIRLFDPRGRRTLQFLHHLGRSTSACEASQQVNMVAYAADNYGLAAQMINNSSKIAVNLLPKRLIPQERSSVLSREDGMNEDFGQGLRHGREDRGETGSDATHFRVDVC
jgi:hypothetical protein